MEDMTNRTDTVELDNSAESDEDNELDSMLKGRVSAAFDSVSLDDEAKSRMLVALQARQFENARAEGEDERPFGIVETHHDAGERTDVSAGTSDAASTQRRVMLYRVGLPIAACLLLVAMIVGVTSMTNRYHESLSDEGMVAMDMADSDSYALEAESASEEAAGSNESTQKYANDLPAEAAAESKEDAAFSLIDYSEVVLSDGTTLDVVIGDDGWPMLLEPTEIGDLVGSCTAQGANVEPLECTVYKDVSHEGRYACIFPDGSIVSLEKHQ